MNRIKLFTAFLVMTLFASAQTSIHDFSFKTIDGKDQSFADFKGKKILIVNTASECGYTPQYEGLQALHEKYKDKVVVIGFPANEFGKQEPGTNEDIASFCKKNYGVTFLMAEKVCVKGKEIHPIFSWLTQQPNPNFTGDIRWNFEKFVLDEAGKLIARFRSGTTPDDEELTKLF